MNFRSRQIGSGCEVLRVDGEAGVRLRVEGGFDLGWRLRSDAGFPGTAVLYEGEWFEVLRREIRPTGDGLAWTYELRQWPDSELIRETFELNAAGVAAAEQRWREREKPFSAKRSVMILLPALGIIAAGAATVGPLTVLPIVWAKTQMDAGQLSALAGRLVGLGGIALGMGVWLWEIRWLNVWLARVNRRFPWMETELWHARNALLTISLLLVVLGVPLAWLGSGERWALGVGMVVSGVAGLIHTWRDPHFG